MKDDVISRQAAISLAGDLQIHSDEYHMYNQAINNYCAEIIKLPSAQPELEKINEAHNEGYDVGYYAGRRDYEKKWIPVTEKLPEEKKFVLVTCEDMYLRKLNPCVGWRNKNNYWFTYVVNGCKHILYPVAWMPLPEPWKGEKHETD